MKFLYLYLIILSILGVASCLCFVKTRKLNAYYKIRIKRDRYIFLKQYIKAKIEDANISKILNQSGISITSSQYQIIRYSVFSIWLILYMIFYKLVMGVNSIYTILLILFLFIITSPRLYFFGKKTPFKHITDFFTNNYKKTLNLEIYRCVSQLKNLAITKNDISMSSDFVLEQLGKFTSKTKPIFNRMIALWSLGKKEEACYYFESTINTKEAKQLSNVFKKLDDLTPNELYNQIALIQESIRKERETNKLVNNENRSNLVYFIVITTSVLVMLNFVVIVYYLESLHQMQFFQ